LTDYFHFGPHYYKTGTRYPKRMPTIYHSEGVFQEYVKRNDGDIQAAKQAIKDAARKDLEQTDA